MRALATLCALLASGCNLVLGLEDHEVGGASTSGSGGGSVASAGAGGSVGGSGGQGGGGEGGAQGTVQNKTSPSPTTRMIASGASITAAARGGFVFAPGAGSKGWWVGFQDSSSPGEEPPRLVLEYVQ